MIEHGIMNAGNAGKLLQSLNVAPEQVRRRVRRALFDGMTESNLELVRRNVRLSELSRRVINAAEQLSLSLDHQMIGLGHLLLVLMRERRSLTSAILRDHALDEARIQQALDRQDATALVSIETVLVQSEEHAQNLGSHYTGTEHLLLAMLVDPDGVKLLVQCGVEPKKLLRTVIMAVENGDGRDFAVSPMNLHITSRGSNRTFA
jgi:ATP-dependent Clp protease ATP-binding subunit ClpA